MSLTSQVDLPVCREAEDMLEKGQYKEAAGKYYDAAIYAQDVLKDSTLSKKLYVEHYLASVSAPGDFSPDTVKNLLNSINNLVLYGQDDKLNGILLPYKEFFSIVFHYTKNEFDELRKKRQLLNEKLSGKNIDEFESLSMILIEVALTWHNFKLGKGSTSVLNDLFKKLTRITSESNLPPDLKEKLREFAMAIKNDKFDEKKN